MDEKTMMETFGVKRIHDEDTQEGALRYITLGDILANLNNINVFRIIFQNQFTSMDGTTVSDEIVTAISKVYANYQKVLTIGDPTLHPEGEDFSVAPTSTSDCRLSIFWAPRSKKERVHDMTDFYSQPRGRLQRFVEKEAKASPWSEAIQGGVTELKRLLRSNAGQMLMTKMRTFNNELIATVGEQVGLGSVEFYTRLLVNLMQSADKQRKRRLRSAKSVAKASSNNTDVRQRLNSSAEGHDSSDSETSPPPKKRRKKEKKKKKIEDRKKSKKKKRRKSNNSSCSEDGSSADDTSPEREPKKTKKSKRKKRASLEDGGPQPVNSVAGVRNDNNEKPRQSGSNFSDATGSFSLDFRKSLSRSQSANHFLNVRHKEGDIAYLATQYIIQGNFPDDADKYSKTVKAALKKKPSLLFTHKVVIGKQGNDEYDQNIGKHADALGLGWVVTQEMEKIRGTEVKEFQGDMLHNIEHTDCAGGLAYLKFYNKKTAAKYADGDSSCVVTMHKKGELTKFVDKYKGKLKIWFSALATESEYNQWAKSSTK